jgi:1-acyl-sn-glycerol-3-phosphate acyltransferase
MAAMMNQLRAWAATLACAIYWVVGGALFLVFGLVLGPILPEATARRVAGVLIRGAFAGFVAVLRVFAVARCEFKGFERLTEVKGGYILAPNHPAIWDAVFILAKLNGLTCIVKASLLKHPLTMAGARLARFVPNDPPGEMVRRCVKALEGGQRLLWFPEGTRTRRGEGLVNEFRGGVALVARHAGVPIYPVYIRTDTEYGAKGYPIWKATLATTHITMELGEPMKCVENESTQDFLERLRSEYIRALSRPAE